MEVCGGHTHTIFNLGLIVYYPKVLSLFTVQAVRCVCYQLGRIDVCIEIARRPEVIFCTFGDAMRVRGRLGSLLEAKAQERGCSYCLFTA